MKNRQFFWLKKMKWQEGNFDICLLVSMWEWFKSWPVTQCEGVLQSVHLKKINGIYYLYNSEDNFYNFKNEAKLMNMKIKDW